MTRIIKKVFMWLGICHAGFFLFSLTLWWASNLFYNYGAQLIVDLFIN